MLDLGIGSGLTAARVLDAHPGATSVGIDASSAMLAAAEKLLDPRERSDDVVTPIDGIYDVPSSLGGPAGLDG